MGVESMKKLLENLVTEASKFASQGSVASYIPQLAVADGNKVGIYLTSTDGEDVYAGDCFDKFTMQSVVKP